MNNDEEESMPNNPLDPDNYISTRQSYDNAELEVSGRYDKWILTLSGGALGLSITFIDKIAKHPTIDTLCWLKVAWACLVLSLLTALLSLVTSQSAIRENRRELDNAHREERSPRLSFPRWFTWITNGLNWGALLLFILGATFLCVFSFKNLDVNTPDGGKKNVQEATRTTGEKGANSRGRLCSPATSPRTERETGLRSISATAKERKEISGNCLKRILNRRPKQERIC
jgi:hypothetical protein